MDTSRSLQYLHEARITTIRHSPRATPFRLCDIQRIIRHSIRIQINVAGTRIIIAIRISNVHASTKYASPSTWRSHSRPSTSRSPYEILQAIYQKIIFNHCATALHVDYHFHIVVWCLDTDAWSRIGRTAVHNSRIICPYPTANWTGYTGMSIQLVGLSTYGP